LKSVPLNNLLFQFNKVPLSIQYWCSIKYQHKDTYYEQLMTSKKACNLWNVCFLLKRCNTFEVIDNRVAIAIMSFFDVVVASDSADESIISRPSKRAQAYVVCMMLMYLRLEHTFTFRKSAPEKSQ
jgi:hypothetical protein